MMTRRDFARGEDREAVAGISQALREISWERRREFDPADTLRFYSLRLREGGMIKAGPGKILADGANF